MDKYTIAPPLGSTNNSVGAEDRPWKEGHFDSVKLNGGDVGEYLAESTGYGIISGCEPSISGLTVTVGAGVVHLSDGTRKEIAETNITLDSADSTNPRIDLVYIDSTGTVAKITGTATASPSAPTLPTGGVNVAQVSVAANATTGTLMNKRGMLPRFYNTGIVNVKDFGAVGDGVHDDTQAFRSAINAAENKILFIPHNTYKITETVLSNVKTINYGEYTDLSLLYDNDKSVYSGGLNNSEIFAKLTLTGASIQGATYDTKRKKIVIGEVNSDNSTQYIITVNPETLEKENIYTYTELGHIHSLEYIEKTDKILVGGGKYLSDGGATLDDTTITIPGVALAYDEKHGVYVSNSYRNLYVSDNDGNLLFTLDTSSITEIVPEMFNNSIILNHECIVSEASSSGKVHIFNLINKEYIGAVQLNSSGEIEDFFIKDNYLYAVQASGYIWRTPLWKSCGFNVFKGLDPMIPNLTADIAMFAFKGSSNGYLNFIFQFRYPIIRPLKVKFNSLKRIINITDNGTTTQNVSLATAGITQDTVALGTGNLSPFLYVTLNSALTSSPLYGTGKLFFIEANVTFEEE